MKLPRLALLTCALAILGCGPSVDANQHWALISAPATKYFPEGNWATPRSEWRTVAIYPSNSKCRAALDRQHAAEVDEHPSERISTQSTDYGKTPVSAIQ
jgi:hypothetical protein